MPPHAARARRIIPAAAVCVLAFALYAAGVHRVMTRAHVEPVSNGNGGAELRLTRETLDAAPSLGGEQPDLIVDATGRARQGARALGIGARLGPRKDVALIGRLRRINGKLANEHLQLRSRYKQVTNFVFDAIHRRDTDWRWDPSVPQSDPLIAKRYLDLGPVLPQLLLSGRAGEVGVADALS